jgi:hypothetical protein
MSTNCQIAVQIEEDKFLMVYCHFDGHILGVGKKLIYYYNDYEKALALVNLGELVSIGNDLDKTETMYRDRKQDYIIKTVSEIDISNTPFRIYYKFKDKNWFAKIQNDWVRLDGFFKKELRKLKLKNLKNGN